MDNTVFFNTLESHVYALDAGAGKKLWDLKKVGNVYSRPAATKGLIYFGSGDGYLYALDSKTGREVWKFYAGAPVNYPTTYGGIVFFGSGTHLFALE